MEGNLDDVMIRVANHNDAAGIAQVHIESWRHAYRDILSPEFLASLDITQRTEQWSDRLNSAHSKTWVADSTSQKIVGFASIGESRDEDATRTTMELYSIYLKPGMWGKGVARNLMRTIFDELTPGTELTLWVLEQNTRARQFYRRHGFLDDGIERIETVGGLDVTEVRYRRK